MPPKRSAAAVPQEPQSQALATWSNLAVARVPEPAASAPAPSQPAATPARAAGAKAVSFNHDADSLGRTSYDHLFAWMDIDDNSMWLLGKLQGRKVADANKECAAWMAQQGCATHRTAKDISNRIRGLQASFNKAYEYRTRTGNGTAAQTLEQAERHVDGESKEDRQARILAAEAEVESETRRLCPLWDRIHGFFKQGEGGSTHLRQGTSTGGDATMRSFLHNNNPAKSDAESDSSSGSSETSSETETQPSNSTDSNVASVSLAQPDHLGTPTSPNATLQSLPNLPETQAEVLGIQPTSSLQLDNADAETPTQTPSLSARATARHKRKRDIKKGQFAGLQAVRDSLAESDQAERADREEMLRIKRAKLEIEERRDKTQTLQAKRSSILEAVKTRMEVDKTLSYDDVYQAEAERYEREMAEALESGL